MRSFLRFAREHTRLLLGTAAIATSLWLLVWHHDNTKLVAGFWISVVFVLICQKMVAQDFNAGGAHSTARMIIMAVKVLSGIGLVATGYWLAFWHHNDAFGRQAFFVIAPVWIALNLAIAFFDRKY